MESNGILRPFFFLFEVGKMDEQGFRFEMGTIQMPCKVEQSERLIEL